MGDSDSARVRQAIKNLERIDPGYHEKMFKQRSGHDSMAAGSIYDMPPEAIKDALMAAKWMPYAHDDIKAPAMGFITHDIEGQEGLIDLRDAIRDGILKPTDMIEFSDPKGVGNPSPTVKAKRGGKTNKTIAILGPYPNTEEEVMFTFHPGEPVRKSELPSEMTGESMTVADAIEKGFRRVKVVG